MNTTSREKPSLHELTEFFAERRRRRIFQTDGQVVRECHRNAFVEINESDTVKRHHFGQMKRELLPGDSITRSIPRSYQVILNSNTATNPPGDYEPSVRYGCPQDSVSSSSRRNPQVKLPPIIQKDNGSKQFSHFSEEGGNTTCKKKSKRKLKHLKDLQRQATKDMTLKQYHQVEMTSTIMFEKDEQNENHGGCQDNGDIKPSSSRCAEEMANVPTRRKLKERLVHRGSQRQPAKDLAANEYCKAEMSTARSEQNACRKQESIFSRPKQLLPGRSNERQVINIQRPYGGADVEPRRNRRSAVCDNLEGYVRERTRARTVHKRFGEEEEEQYAQWTLHQI
jgi:hypothetical protein